ncbi:MAG: winged helix-turn-helix domain-containing protein [Thermoprotei archaeon]
MTEKKSLERLFSSKSSVKVLSFMLEKGETNISELVKSTGLSHRSVANAAEKLSELGVIREKRFGRIRIYQTVSDSKLVALFKTLSKELDEVWEKSNQQSS